MIACTSRESGNIDTRAAQARGIRVFLHPCVNADAAAEPGRWI
ncbi:hypothetical protein MJ579_08480 [Klebsiella pneumoniae]|nr:hypothetical protein MJ579_08480 [Klebsiella pneumoniae]